MCKRKPNVRLLQKYTALVLLIVLLFFEINAGLFSDVMYTII